MLYVEEEGKAQDRSVSEKANIACFSYRREVGKPKRDTYNKREISPAAALVA